MLELRAGCVARKHFPFWGEDMSQKKRILKRDASSFRLRLIGLAGFEPATPSPPDLYAKPLRYSPKTSDILAVLTLLFNMAGEKNPHLNLRPEYDNN